ncbi:hypothetical protein ACROYT_G016437 [Oculina patagonica]
MPAWKCGKVLFCTKIVVLLNLFCCVADNKFNKQRIRFGNFWQSRIHEASAVVNRRVVGHILMDDIVGEMHLDVRKITDSLAPFKINVDGQSEIVSGYFFNYHDHKPTFKLDSKDKSRVSLTGGPLSATYLLDQFHFHVYCTRAEAEENTLDGSHVPGELHLVFFRKNYKSYSKAVHRFQDGLVTIAIPLVVGEDDNDNLQIAKFLSFVDYISPDQNRTVSTTTSIRQLATSVFNKHAQYDAYRGKLVEPVKCENCLDVFVLKEPIIITAKQMTEFRKAPHCVENDWAF